MSMIVPNAIEVEVITNVLTPALHLRLFSNNVTPDQTSTAASFTEVTGGGYAAVPLTFANWGIVSGDPSLATYNANQFFDFTGPTGGPGTIYGYFVTRDSDGHLMWSERFPPANVPFVPQNGSEILILPRFSAQSEF
jgi:hypothetical protein